MKGSTYIHTVPYTCSTHKRTANIADAGDSLYISNTVKFLLLAAGG